MIDYTVIPSDGAILVKLVKFSETENLHIDVKFFPLWKVTSHRNTTCAEPVTLFDDDGYDFVVDKKNRIFSEYGTLLSADSDGLRGCIDFIAAYVIENKDYYKILTDGKYPSLVCEPTGQIYALR